MNVQKHCGSSTWAAASNPRLSLHWQRPVAVQARNLPVHHSLCSRSRRLAVATAGPQCRTSVVRNPRLSITAMSTGAAGAPAAAGGTAAPPQTDKSGVVIVGGGPAGYASAMMLARRGWTDITLVEAQADPTYADPDRSYVYCIDGRGRKWLEPAGLMPALQAASVGTGNMIINRIATSGKVKATTMSIKDASRVTNWLPRTAFMQLLVDALAADPAARAAVRVATCTRAADYQLGSDGRIAVTLQRLDAAAAGGGATGKAPVVAAAAAGVATVPGGSIDTQSPAATAQPQVEVLYPRLLVACDGFRSSVRAALSAWSPGTFNSVSFPSLSTGLRYKVLRLPPNPTTKEGVVLSNSTIAVLEGRASPRLAGGNPLRMGLLPVRDPAAPRTGNINLLPDHPFWDITEAEEMYDVFQQSFPQMDWRALVPYEVMARYAASRGGTFPAPQYTTHLSWIPDQARDACQQQQQQQGEQHSNSAAGGSPHDKRTSVVLLGDAAHCFPPDLGQGVNSALEDIVVLEGAMEEAGDDPAAAARLYQQRRIQDAAALAKLVQVGYPLQYKQYKLRERLFFVGFTIQLLLSKVLPWLVQPPIFMLVQDPARSYSSIWAGAQRTTAALQAMAAAAAVGAAVLVGRALLTGTPA